MRRIAVLMGTRPEGIKLAPVVARLTEAPDLEAVVVSTGQHREMLRQVVDLFGFTVDHELDLMRPGQTLAGLTARLLDGIDDVLAAVEPDLVLVQGDTTTVLCGALTAFYRRTPIGHVEAGLRTGDLQAPFPEEANRTIVSRLAALHFAPTRTAEENLRREGVDPASIEVTGNTVIDALHLEVARQREPAVARSIDTSLSALVGPDWRERPYVLVTGHRRESFGEGFEAICRALADLSARFEDHRWIYPVHLNPNVRGPVHERLGSRPNVTLLEPLDYRLFVALMTHGRLVLTDSGGIQEEAPALGKPVLVMRETTERPEGVAAGTVRLVGAIEGRIVSSVSELLTDRTAYDRMATAVNPYGDGTAAARIVERIRAAFAGGLFR